MEDILREEAWSEYHAELVMERAAMEQCIYVLVEGESEENTFETLLEEGCGLKFSEYGVVIANYNGIGNLKHTLRLLSKTLSHNRPVIVTYDDDIAGKHVENLSITNNISLFKIPQTPVVKYRNGQMGGSFEEAFDAQIFIDSCFQLIKNGLKCSGTQNEFQNSFQVDKPWLAQFARYLELTDGNAKSINKVDLAQILAVDCDPIPDTFLLLAEQIKEIRANNPVRNPDDVDMPSSW